MKRISRKLFFVVGKPLCKAPLQAIETPLEITVLSDQLTQVNEGADDHDARLDGEWTIENGRRHDSTMFSKGSRKCPSSTLPACGHNL